MMSHGMRMRRVSSFPADSARSASDQLVMAASCSPTHRGAGSRSKTRPYSSAADRVELRGHGNKLDHATWSVGSRELRQPRTGADGMPVTERNLSLRASARIPAVIRVVADSALVGPARAGLADQSHRAGQDGGHRWRGCIGAASSGAGCLAPAWRQVALQGPEALSCLAGTVR
jgi:hypothetical protein